MLLLVHLSLLFTNCHVNAQSAVVINLTDYAVASTYVRALKNIPCTTNFDCAAMALDPGVLEGECVQRRCFDSTNLENAIIDATNVNVLGPAAFCIYERVYEDVVNALPSPFGSCFSTNPNAGLCNLFFYRYSEYLECSSPEEDEAQCLRPLCGARASVPGTSIGPLAYGCHAAVTDTFAQANYGNNWQLDPLNTDRSYSLSVVPFEPVFDWAANIPRTVQQRIMTSATYKIEFNVAQDFFKFSYRFQDTLFLPEGTPCAPLDPRLAPFCNVQTCNGLGLCGSANATREGSVCPFEQIYLGDAYANAANADPSQISSGCVLGAPRCLRATSTLGFVSGILGEIVNASFEWIDDVRMPIYGPPGSTAGSGTTPQATTGAPYERDQISAGWALAPGSSPPNAPLLCAFDYGEALRAAPNRCVPDPGTPPPPAPECYDVTAENASALLYNCYAFHRGTAAGAFDANGFVVVEPHIAFPDDIVAAECRPVPLGRGTPCDAVSAGPIPPQFAAPRGDPGGGDDACVVPQCDGEGGCAWMALEEGTACRGSPPTPHLDPECHAHACLRNGTCVLVLEPPGTPCSDDNGCTIGDVCDGGGACAGAPTADCVRCSSDLECQCTGEGAVVGFCDLEHGRCSEPVLTDPALLVNASAGPLPPGVLPYWLPSWVAEGGSDVDPKMGSWRQARSAAGPRPCVVPLGPEYAEHRCWSPHVTACHPGGVCGPPAPLECFRVLEVNVTFYSGLVPNCTDGNGTVPNGTVPNGTVPNGTVPNGTVPNCTVIVNCSQAFPPQANALEPNPEAVALGCTVTTALLPNPTPGECTLSNANCTVEPLSPDLLYEPNNTVCRSGTFCAPEWTCDGMGTCGGPPPIPASANASCVPTEEERGGGPFCAINDSFVCSGSFACVPLAPVQCPSQGACLGLPQCDPRTGACVAAPLPYGTPCTDVCSPFQSPGSVAPEDLTGRCDGIGSCIYLESEGRCDDGSPCTFDFCARTYNLGPPANRSVYDVATLAEIGECAPPGQAPIERILGQGVTMGCSDGTLCTVADSCDGAGNCISGPNTQCPSAEDDPCVFTSACQPSSGICTLARFAQGTPCAPSGAGACVVNATCGAQGECAGSLLACPPVTGSIGCAGFAGVCRVFVNGTDTSSWLPPGTIPTAEDVAAAIANGTEYVVAVDVALLSGCAYASSIQGSICSTGNACESIGRCVDGECVAEPIECTLPPGAQCLDEASGVCTPSGLPDPFPPFNCSFDTTPGASCSDSDPCTIFDECLPNGTCAGLPAQCPPLIGECIVYGPGGCADGCPVVNIPRNASVLCGCPSYPPPDPVECKGFCDDGVCVSECIGGCPGAQTCSAIGNCVCPPGREGVDCVDTSTPSDSIILEGIGYVLGFLLWLAVPITLLAILLILLASCFLLPYQQRTLRPGK